MSKYKKKEKGYRGIEELKPSQEARDKRNYHHQLARYRKQSTVADSNHERGSIVEIVYPDRINWVPTCTEEENKIANDLVFWAHKNDSIYLADFPLSIGISPHKFYAIAEKNKYFAEALSTAKALIGSRLFKAAFYGNVANQDVIWATALKYLPVLDKEFEEAINKKAATAAAAAEQVRKGFTVVELPSFKE